jgi:ParB/RepB/Spo0J family partition protein
MTSGEFHRIPINKIWLNRDERQRRELKDIDVLADSIRRLGLIHPLVIDRNYKLCAGERRLSAIKSLGHDFVMCQFLDELDVAHQRTIELEENIKRTDLTWQEQCNAVKEYHDIRSYKNPDWLQEKTAAALGLSENSISRYLAISEEAKTNPRIMDQPLLSTAVGIVQRDQERRDAAKIQGVFDLPKEDRTQSILHANFLEWAPAYTGPKFNFLHCDFPYGIDTDQRGQGNAVAIQGAYDDSRENYWNLLKCLCDNLNRICTESAHIMFWFSMHYYTDTLDYFARHSDFTIDPFPLIWMKSDGKGLIPDPQRGPRRIYETCLFGSRGDRKIVSSVANAYAAPTDSRGHVSVKPEPVLRHFFRMLVDENSTMLDPTCGSGSALRAAESLDAALVIGVETVNEYVERATLALDAARRLRKATA